MFDRSQINRFVKCKRQIWKMMTKKMSLLLTGMLLCLAPDIKGNETDGRIKGIVMDGRDIGTAVFPQAELKIFVTASTEVRARRRYDELKSKGQQVDLEEVRKNVEERDYIDTHRETAPLRQAEDAIVLDNSNMTIEEQHRWLLEQLKTKIEQD